MPRVQFGPVRRAMKAKARGNRKLTQLVYRLAKKTHRRTGRFYALPPKTILKPFFRKMSFGEKIKIYYGKRCFSVQGKHSFSFFRPVLQLLRGSMGGEQHDSFHELHAPYSPRVESEIREQVANEKFNNDPPTFLKA